MRSCGRTAALLRGRRSVQMAVLRSCTVGMACALNQALTWGNGATLSTFTRIAGWSVVGGAGNVLRVDARLKTRSHAQRLGGV